MSRKRRRRPRASFISITEEQCRMISPSTRLLEVSDAPKHRKQMINFITGFRFCLLVFLPLSFVLFCFVWGFLQMHKRWQNRGGNPDCQITGRCSGSGDKGNHPPPKPGKNSDCILRGDCKSHDFTITRADPI